MQDFFGELSRFEIIVAAAAFLGTILGLLTGGYTLYKNFIERAKVRLHPGDRVSFVISHPGEVRKFHLSANLVNEAVKTGTVHRLETRLTGPGIDGFLIFTWKLFFEYRLDGITRIPSSAPYAIAIPGKSSHLARVEFELASTYKTPSWLPGEYRFDVLGWVNKTTRATKPNLRSTFHVRLTSGAVHDLEHAPGTHPQFYDCVRRPMVNTDSDPS